MRHNRFGIFCGIFAALVFLASVPRLIAGEYLIRGSTDKEVAIYAPGEPMVFTLRVFDGDTPVAGKLLKWTRTGDDGKTEKGEAVAGEEGLTVTTSLDSPGFVRIHAFAFEADGSKLEGFVGGWGEKKPGHIFFDGGACVKPEDLQPVKEPADFDEFWKAARASLASTPLRAELKEVKSSNSKVKVFAVTLDCAGPRPVTGYLSLPEGAGEKSLPAAVSFHGYGVRKHGAPGNPSASVISFDVNAHGMELEREDAYYEQLKEELKGYAFNKEENTDREKTYFYGMALRVMRALEYVKSLPEWNGVELRCNGGSQGGLQALWGAGLDEAVTSGDIWPPWCCDLGGITLGRIRGWRPDYDMALDYYDPVFHARRIKNARIALIANYGDYTCPPSSVWMVYNNIPREDKSMEVRQGCTHSYQMPGYMGYTITPAGIRDVGIKGK